MAKGIDINGQLRGKRGGVVYYRANGQQISRSRNFNPNNPQTMAQMLQRLALANASKMSKGLKGIIDHSFEGVRYGADSVRHFESKAQLALKSAFTGGDDGKRFCAFVPMDALGFPVAEVLISSGSLASAKGSFSRNNVNGVVGDFTSTDAIATLTQATLTPRLFCQLFGVSVDSQITLIMTSAQESVGGAGSEVIFNDNILSGILRINFDPTKLDEPMTDSNGLINANVLIADKSTNVDLVRVQVDEDEVVGQVTIALNVTNCNGAAIIISRYVDGMWRRSTEKLTIAAPFGSEDPAELIETWGWNWYDEVVKTLFKGSALVEDKLLNKEDNAN